MISFNSRFVEMWRIPDAILQTRSDEQAIQFVLDALESPDEFREGVKYLYANKEVKLRDELKLKDGRVFDRYSAPMFGADEKYYGRVFYFRDVTEGKRADQEKFRLANHVRLLMESTGEGIYGIDLKGNCTFINRAALEMIGYGAEEALGRNMHDLIHHSLPDGSAYPVKDCFIFRTFRRGESCRVDDEVLWKRDGSSFPAEYSSFPIITDEIIQGAVVTFTHISERKEAEHDLRD